MRKLIFSVALLALPAWASAAPADATLAGPVIYEVRSWGRLLVRWQVNPDGTGEIWRQGQGQDTGVWKYRLRMEDSAFRTFATNVEDARRATQDGIACKKEIFDLPYGSITWDYPAGRQVYSFDAGCRSEVGDKVQDILTAANSNVETLARIDPKPYMTEPITKR